MIKKYKKGESVQLTRNFNSSEMDCKCKRQECTFTLIDLDHMEKLQQLRQLVGPLKITSGYRCEAHNKAVGGVKNSSHVTGHATDIKPVGNFLSDKPKDALQKVKQQVGHFDGTASEFKGAGLNYSTFIHLDSKPGSKRRW